MGMGVCIGYTLICWIVDLAAVGNMHPGVRAQILSPAGLVTTGIGFILSLVARHRRPMMSSITMAACILWLLWEFWPRL